jgi:NAD(P)-dependent dehydrogenase (short-subunit alcohol dehydrogenase family)
LARTCSARSAAITARLRADGFRVAIADIDVAAAAGSGPETGETLVVPVDVTDPDSVAAMRDTVLGRWGRMDVLVNNAGIAGPTAPVTGYPPDAWQRVIMVNLVGVFHCTRACLPPMIAAGYGRVVNIASIAGKDGNPDMSAYSASKAGVIAFTKSVGKETAKTGVLVTAWCRACSTRASPARRRKRSGGCSCRASRWAAWAGRRNWLSSCPGSPPSAPRSAPARRSTCPGAGRSTEDY